MLHHKEQPSANTIYKQPEMTGSCILCGKDTMAVNFKGKCVCEDCLTFVKELY
jgi:hypothetical protein